MLIAELTVLVFCSAIHSLLYFFSSHPQLVLWFLLPLICLFLRSDTLRHGPAALMLQSLCWDSAHSAAFVLVGKCDLGGTETAAQLSRGGWDKDKDLALPEVGGAPGLGSQGSSWCSWALCHLLSSSCAQGRGSFSVPDPGAGTLWEVLPTPRGSELPSLQTWMNPVHIQCFFFLLALGVFYL